ncbi:MAG: PAS domain S-box protein, partial [Terriglobales bacterium]
ALASLLHAAELDAQASMRAKDILAQANLVSRLYTDVDLAMSNYCLTRSSLYAATYDKSKRSLEEAKAVLVRLPVNAAQETAVLADMSKRADGGIRILDRVKQALDDDKQNSRFVSRQMYKAIRAIATVPEADLNMLTGIEDALRLQGKNEFGWNLLVKAGLAAGLLFNTLLMIVLARYFMKEIKGRLQVLSDNSVRLSRGEPLNPPVSGTDEIAELDSVFHMMARGLSEARRKERALLENARDMICSIGANGVFTEVSPASLAVLGYKHDDLLGQRYITSVCQEDKERTLEQFESCMQTGSPLLLENRILRKDGAAADVLWSGTWSAPDQSLFCVLHD